MLVDLDKENKIITISNSFAMVMAYTLLKLKLLNRIGLIQKPFVRYVRITIFIV